MFSAYLRSKFMKPLPPPVKLNPYFFPPYPGEPSFMRAWFERKGPLIVCLMLAVSFFVFYRFTANTKEQNEPNRRALAKIYQELTPGMPLKDALKIIHTNKLPEMTVWYGREYIGIETLPEFGAKGWELQISFKDGQVCEVKVRTEDGPPPSDGPPDKILFESAEPNPS